MTAAVNNPAAVIPAPIGCLEAERGVLGGLLCLPALEAQVATDNMVSDDFTDPRHGVIFESVAELTAAGTPADPITVSGHLRRTGQERCFTSDRAPAVYLFDLLDALPSVGNLGYSPRPRPASSPRPSAPSPAAPARARQARPTGRALLLCCRASCGHPSAKCASTASRPWADRHARLYADTRPVGARRGGASDWFLRPGSAGQRDEPVGALGGFKRSPGWHV